jgi:hypothetical protein
MNIPQRTINTGEQVARHMEIADVLGIGVDSLLDTVAYLTGESDTPPEFSPTYGGMSHLEEND